MAASVASFVRSVSAASVSFPFAPAGPVAALGFGLSARWLRAARCVRAARAAGLSVVVRFAAFRVSVFVGSAAALARCPAALVR